KDIINLINIHPIEEIECLNTAAQAITLFYSHAARQAQIYICKSWRDAGIAPDSEWPITRYKIEVHIEVFACQQIIRSARSQFVSLPLTGEGTLESEPKTKLYLARRKRIAITAGRRSKTTSVFWRQVK